MCFPSDTSHKNIQRSLTAVDEEFLTCIRSKSTSKLMKSVLDWLNPDYPDTGILSLLKTVWYIFTKTLSIPNGINPPLAPLMPWGPAIDGKKKKKNLVLLYK